MSRKSIWDFAVLMWPLCIINRWISDGHGIWISFIVSYKTPHLEGSYAPITDHSKTAPYVRYISSGLYIKVIALENFSMCLWTPYKDALWCLKFDQGGVRNFRKLEPLRKSDN